MKTLSMTVVLCAVLILCTSGPVPAKLFLVEVDGQKVVADFFVESEQTWQWGLYPYMIHFYEFKIWYPYLADTFDMTLDEQLESIEDLDYAGIEDWRIGYYWDTVPLKASLFQGLNVGMNQRFNYNSDVYFLHTSEVSWGPTTLYQTHGRTGDELGDPAQGGNGAIIEAGGGFNFDDYDPDDDLDYGSWGTLIPGSSTEYYTLVPTHGQDHYWQMGPAFHMYDSDINCSPDYLPYAIQMGEVPMGAWTLSESMPQLWSPNHKFRQIRISDAINPAGELPAGTLVPVTIVSVMQDEAVISEETGNTSPDAEVDYTDEAAVVSVRAERDGEGNGRVYHIEFADGVRTYTLTVGVPNNQGMDTLLVDDGPIYDSLSQ